MICFLWWLLLCDKKTSGTVIADQLDADSLALVQNKTEAQPLATGALCA
jgi:hypothetical protein